MYTQVVNAHQLSIALFLYTNSIIFVCSWFECFQPDPQNFLLSRRAVSLVDAYTKVLQPVAAQRAYVESGRDRQKTLERCVHRWEFDREKQAKKEATLAAADADRVAFRSIDWHDFVVVEVWSLYMYVFVSMCCVSPLHVLDIRLLASQILLAIK